MKRVKWIGLFLVLMMAATAFVGCAQTPSKEEAPKTETPQAGDQGTDTQKEDKLEGKVEIIGSTSVHPLAQDLADAFANVEPGIKVDIQAVGSTAGVVAAHEGTANIGMASRNLKPGEKEWGLTEHVIAKDGIAVVVHPDNKITDLSKEDISKIFKGEIKNWKDVGGVDKEIIVISREAGSGTRGAFEDIMDLEVKKDGKKMSALKEDALIANGSGAVKADVLKKEHAIGYVSLGYLDDSIKGVKVDGVEPTVENVKAGKFPIARPFLMLTKGELTPQAKAYMDFVMGADGQNIVSEKFISVK